MIYFKTVQYGVVNWIYTIDGKKKRIYKKEITQDPRLNFPSRRRIDDAIRRVKNTCPESAKLYKNTAKILKEASRRYNATLSSLSWKRYKNYVAYQTKVAEIKKLSRQEFKNKWTFIKYNIYELHEKRILERNRAYKEFMAASDKMKLLESQIFDLMEVPLEYRRFNLDE